MNNHPANLPPSAFRIPPSRPALTLVEVLIAMGVMTIGLLGVASLFPVGGHYMQTGDVADRAGAVAQAALEDAVVQGYLRPENWVVHDGSANPANTAARFISYLDGWRDAPPFPLKPGLRAAIQNQLAVDNAARPIHNAGQAKNFYTAKLLGGAIVLDPLGIGGALTNEPFTVVRNAISASPLARFPASLPDITPGSSDAAWTDWTVTTPPFQWPVRRATPIHSAAELNAAATYNRQLPRAQAGFSSVDDLALTLPSSGDLPGRGRWRTVGKSTGAPAAARQPAGDFSWLLSVTPASTLERDALALRRDAYPVEVSAVVFHKRTVPRTIQGLAETERLVTAKVVTTSPGGGELLLTKRGGENAANSPLRSLSPFEGLRAGEFVMVVGPHPLSSAANPRLTLKWCRVLNVEEQGRIDVPNSASPINLDPDQQVLVALRGPDWPWQPASDIASTNQLSNNLRVAILPGAVAVHTKTMRLEAGSEWSVD